MANLRRMTSDTFSFPTIITEHSNDQFEFGCVTTNTPGSPNSPADHLFSNGKLMPHVFPVQDKNFSYSRSTSRTSSISSKDSIMLSSCNNSTNSRNSTCSSARTSISTEASDRNIPSIISMKERNRFYGLNSHYQYGSSKRWQFIVATPVLKQEGLRSRKVDKCKLDPKASTKERAVKSSWFGWRVLKLFVSACLKCHAINTSNVDGVL